MKNKCPKTMSGFWLVTISYIILIGFLMIKLNPLWFLGLLLWHWQCLWEDHSLHRNEE